MGISDTMAQLEHLRKRGNTFMSISVIAPILAMIMLGTSMIGTNPENAIAFPLAFVFIMVSVLVCTYSYGKNQKAFKKIYKETFVVKSLSNYFSQVVYDWEHGFSEQQVQTFGLSRLGNRFSSEDYLRGIYKDVHFEQADVTIKYHSNSGKNSSTTTYFRGRMFAFEFPKNQVFSLQIHSKNFLYAKRKPGDVEMQKIEMESEYFNKNFVVRSANAHDAFYVLTPALMERIQALKEKYRTLIMYFSGGRLCIGIEGCTDTFDPPTGKKLSYPDEQARIRHDVQDIIDVIDTMTQNSAV